MRMKKLLVNADDFGLNTAVTDGIIEAHQSGIVTSTSIIAAGMAFDYAVREASANQSLGVGVHLTLVEEQPVCDAREIGTLIQRNGRLPKNYRELLSGIGLRNICLEHVDRELRAQVDKCFSAGLKPTHLDSHQHVHALPSVFRIVLGIARDYGIRGIRLPRDSPWRRGAFRCNGFWHKSLLCMMARYDAFAFGGERFSTCDRMAGVFDSGDLSEDRLVRILDRVLDGSTELVCHPGKGDIESMAPYAHWRYNWQAELKALTSESVKCVVRAKNIELITYDGVCT